MSLFNVPSNFKIMSLTNSVRVLHSRFASEARTKAFKRTLGSRPKTGLFKASKSPKTKCLQAIGGAP